MNDVERDGLLLATHAYSKLFFIAALKSGLIKRGELGGMMKAMGPLLESIVEGDPKARQKVSKAMEIISVDVGEIDNPNGGH